MTALDEAQREYREAQDALEAIRTRIAPLNEEMDAAIRRSNKAFDAVISAKLGQSL
jgi:hypothetical protein